MKKVFFVILSSLFYLPGIAQSDSLAIAHERINRLEAQLQEQSAQLNKISSDVNEVLKQNLALKKNLNLTPTIAKAKAHNAIEYRVIEVTGNPITKDIHLVLSASNNGDTDKRIFYADLEVIDELGHGYNERDRRNLKVEGLKKEVIGGVLEHHPNTPLTMDFYIKGYDSNSQYIKYLGMDVVDGSVHAPVKFENLPIKWIEDED